MIRRVLTLFGAAITALVLAVGLAPAAQAGEGYIYIAFPTWLGNCPGGGKVTVINATNGRNNWTTRMEGPDDITYAKVVFGVVQPISFQNLCSRSLSDGGPYWSVPTQRYIVPNVYGQTVWLGPAGQRWS